METINYYRDNQTIKNEILNLVEKKGQVVYGQQAVNVQLPKNLNRATKDYDIYSKKPKKSAKELMNSLNKEYETKEFSTEKALHKGTFKVKRGEDTIADYTKSKNKINSKKILGINYENINSQKRKLNKMIKDETQLFRREKDLDTLSKIKQSEVSNFLNS